jgi:hypothetical protein
MISLASTPICRNAEDGMAERTVAPSRSSPYLFPAKIDSSLSCPANHIHDAPILDPCEIYTVPQRQS